MHNYTFDLIRVVAMSGVVADHYFQATGCPCLVNTGLCFGGVNVAIFFTLSAYLFGEKWRAGDGQKFKVLPFLKKRFLRIFIPLWIALIAIIALEKSVLHPIDIETVLFNFVGLSWMRPFIWAGHLWYVTMSLILYLMFIVVSNLKAMRMLPVWCWLIMLTLLSVGMMTLPQVFNSVSRVLIPLTVFFSLMVFVAGDRLMEWSLAHRWAIGFMAVGLSVVTWYLHIDGLFQESKGVANVLNSLSGLMLFFAITAIGQRIPKAGWVVWGAGISYELYLIHPTVMMTVQQLVDGNTVMYYVVSLGLIVACAAVLHQTCNRINHISIKNARC